MQFVKHALDIIYSNVFNPFVITNLSILKSHFITQVLQDIYISSNNVMLDFGFSCTDFSFFT
jgi:hypothetical protein